MVLTVWCSRVSAALRACWGSRELTADFSRPAAWHVKTTLLLLERFLHDSVNESREDAIDAQSNVPCCSMKSRISTLGFCAIISALPLGFKALTTSNLNGCFE